MAGAVTSETPDAPGTLHPTAAGATQPEGHQIPSPKCWSRNESVTDTPGTPTLTPSHKPGSGAFTASAPRTHAGLCFAALTHALVRSARSAGICCRSIWDVKSQYYFATSTTGSLISGTSTPQMQVLERALEVSSK